MLFSIIISHWETVDFNPHRLSSYKCLHSTNGLIIILWDLRQFCSQNILDIWHIFEACKLWNVNKHMHFLFFYNYNICSEDSSTELHEKYPDSAFGLYAKIQTGNLFIQSECRKKWTRKTQIPLFFKQWLFLNFLVSKIRKNEVISEIYG